MKIKISIRGSEVEFEGREWKDRITFTTSKSRGQAVWDKSKRQWVKVHQEFGADIKAKIQEQL